MTTATVTNNRPRRQLSDQIDRLDAILDGLSEALNDAVADASKEGVRLAVKDAVIELMTDPTLRARLHDATAPEPAPEPAQPAKKVGFWARMKAKVGQAVSAVTRASSQMLDGAVRGVQVMAKGAAEGIHSLQCLGSLRELAVLGVGVGVAVGVTSFLAPHIVAAAVSAVSSAVAAAAVQVGVWTRRTLRAFTLA